VAKAGALAEVPAQKFLAFLQPLGEYLAQLVLGLFHTGTLSRADAEQER
jgi:hypothetical protein